MRGTPDPRAYWDGRILDWDAGRYDSRLSIRLGPAEWLAGVLPQPTRARQRACLELLAPFIADRDILELGCGTGRMAAGFVAAGCRSYSGTDHSPVAIDAARGRYQIGPEAEKIRFEVRRADDIPQSGEETVVSLGVLDWLTDEELGALFHRQGSRHFLHSFSEFRTDIRQLGHRLCRAADRVLRPNAVRPRYMSADHLVGLMPPARRGQIFVYRDTALRFTSFLSSLSLTGATHFAPERSRLST